MLLWDLVTSVQLDGLDCPKGSSAPCLSSGSWGSQCLVCQQSPLGPSGCLFHGSRGGPVATSTTQGVSFKRMQKDT